MVCNPENDAQLKVTKIFDVHQYFARYKLEFEKQIFL